MYRDSNTTSICILISVRKSKHVSKSFLCSKDYADQLVSTSIDKQHQIDNVIDKIPIVPILCLTLI